MVAIPSDKNHQFGRHTKIVENLQLPNSLQINSSYSFWPSQLGLQFVPLSRMIVYAGPIAGILLENSILILLIGRIRIILSSFPPLF
jgi:hypothetical protein